MEENTIKVKISLEHPSLNYVSTISVSSLDEIKDKVIDTVNEAKEIIKVIEEDV